MPAPTNPEFEIAVSGAHSVPFAFNDAQLQAWYAGEPLVVHVAIPNGYLQPLTILTFLELETPYLNEEEEEITYGYDVARLQPGGVSLTLVANKLTSLGPASFVSPAETELGVDLVDVLEKDVTIEWQGEPIVVTGGSPNNCLMGAFFFAPITMPES